MSSKATKATVARRIEEILQIRLDGAEGFQILQYVAEKQAAGEEPWTIPDGGKPIAERTVWWYIARADELVKESYCKEAGRRRRLRLHLARRRNLYAKAVSQGDIRAALACLDSEAKLVGLFDDEVNRQIDALAKEIAEMKATYGNPNPCSETTKMLNQRTILHGVLSSTWHIGLDLGQAADFTALAAIERKPRPKQPALLELQLLRRWPLGTPCPEIVKDVLAILDKPARQNSSVRPLRGCAFGLDATGVGRAIVDMFVAARPPARLMPVTITAGNTVSHEGGMWRVPKADLVAVVNATLQTKRLSWDPRIPFDEVLTKELATFETRLTAAGNEQFSARVGQHDDLVLAVAIATWLAERAAPTPGRRPVAHGGMTRLMPQPGEFNW